MPENPKAYDTAFKSLSDADPRGLLDIFGVLPLRVDAEVEPLPRDIAARPLVIDSGYFVRPAKAPAFIAVFEALTSWKREIGTRLASYGAALGDKYKMPIRMFPLPLARRACPSSVPEFGRATYGDVEVTVRLRWIKPWEVDAQVVLEHNSPTLDAWAVLFHRSPVQTDAILRRLQSRPEDAGTFRTLGGMRYRRVDDVGWKELLRRFDSMITKEQLRESLAVQEWLEEGEQKGEVKRVRTDLLAVVEIRFPKLDIRDEIESISDLNLLNSLFRSVVKAPNIAAARRAIFNRERLSN